MNLRRLRLMSQMLGEVIDGTWQPTAKTLPQLRAIPIAGNLSFELRSWFGLTPDYCGYSACAVGHACLDDRFNQEGLVFGHSGPEYVGPDGQGYAPSWEGISEFFYITYDLAEHLFAQESYFDQFEPNVKWTRDGSTPPVPPAWVKARVDELIEKGMQE